MTTGPPAAHAPRLLAEATDPLVVDPSTALVRSVVSQLHDDAVATDVDRVRILCSTATADDAFRDFLAASRAADAVAADRLAIRIDDALDASYTLAGGAVHAHISESLVTDDRDAATAVHAVSSDDHGLYEAVETSSTDRWNSATQYTVDAPAYGPLLETFSDEWPAAGETLAGAFEAVETLTPEDTLDPVTVCTLVGGRHRLLAMRLGEWAEAAEFSSRTEIARAKQRLIDAGLIETEREPNGVGRPRHRLVPAADVADAPPPELVAAAQSALRD